MDGTGTQAQRHEGTKGRARQEGRVTVESFRYSRSFVPPFVPPCLRATVPSH